MIASASLLSAIGLVLLVTAAAFVLLSLLASHLRFERLADQAESGTGSGSPADLEMAVANRIGRVGRGSAGFLVGLARLVEPEPRADQLRVLAGRLRHDDRVLDLGPDRIGLIVNAPRARADRIGARLVESGRWAVGLAACPGNGERARDVIDAAARALAGVPAASGWQLADAGGAGPPPPTASAPPAPLPPDQLWPAVQRYVARFRKEAVPVTILSLRIDMVDWYRKEYGEDTLLAVARELVVWIPARVRAEDLTAADADGGFIVVMASRVPVAAVAAQRLIEEVRSRVFIAGQTRMKITLGAGLAGYPEHGGHPGDLLERARRARGEAHRQGRGQCVVFYDALAARPASTASPAADTL
jgi:GGDEF domain-containing protein